MIFDAGKIDWIQTVRIPGLPPGGRLVMADAERAGAWQPSYSAAEISKIFFTRRNGRFVSTKLSSVDPPEIGTDNYFTPLWENDETNKTGQRWTLGEVERMIIHLYASQAITYTQYTIGRQMVAWTARGFGCFHDY